MDSYDPLLETPHDVRAASARVRWVRGGTPLLHGTSARPHGDVDVLVGRGSWKQVRLEPETSRRGNRDGQGVEGLDGGADRGPGFEGSVRGDRGLHDRFERYTEPSDITPLFVGLPNDQCQSPHWAT
jgi:hypothetical protein